MKNIPRWLDGYIVRNRIKKFNETKAKVAKFEAKHLIAKIEGLENKLEQHDHKESCECYQIRQEIKDLKERLHDEVISNDTDILLSTKC